MSEAEYESIHALFDSIYAEFKKQARVNCGVWWSIFWWWDLVSRDCHRNQIEVAFEELQVLGIRWSGLLGLWQHSVSWLGQCCMENHYHNSLWYAFLILCTFLKMIKKEKKKISMYFYPTVPLLVIYLIDTIVMWVK